jgi:hypothetical protein
LVQVFIDREAFDVIIYAVPVLKSAGIVKTTR